MLALPIGMGAHCALRTSGDQLFLQTVRVELLEGCVCVCVCVCWVGGHVTHIPLICLTPKLSEAICKTVDFAARMRTALRGDRV